MLADSPVLIGCHLITCVHHWNEVWWETAWIHNVSDKALTNNQWCSGAELWRKTRSVSFFFWYSRGFDTLGSIRQVAQRSEGTAIPLTAFCVFLRHNKCGRGCGRIVSLIESRRCLWDEGVKCSTLRGRVRPIRGNLGLATGERGYSHPDKSGSSGSDSGWLCVSWLFFFFLSFCLYSGNNVHASKILVRVE